jgi:putative flippase GtrA
MKRRDLWATLVIGAAVGLLIQPILANNLPQQYHLTFALRVGIFIFFTLIAPFALYVASLLARIMPTIYQFAQFAAVGTLNSFIDVGIFNLETFFNGTADISNGLFATFKALSFLCATTNSFVWNKYWTFDAKGKANAGQVTAFYGIALVGWALNVSVATLVKSIGPGSGQAHLSLWVNVVAPLAGIAASLFWNFAGYKYFVFKKPAEMASGE